MSCPQLEGYLDELRRLGRASHTLGQARRWVEEYWRFCQGEGVHQLAQLRPDHLARFIEARLGQPKVRRRGGLLSERSVYVGQQAVKAFLRWAWASGHLRQDLTQDTGLTRTLRATVPLLTPAELERVMAQPALLHTALALRDRALLEVFWGARLLRHQACGLDLADIQMRARLLQVRGRGGPRVLTDRMAQALSLYLADGRPQLYPCAEETALFLESTGQRLEKATITQLVRFYGDRVGLRALSLLNLGQPPRN